MPLAGLVVGVAGYLRSRRTGTGAVQALIGITLSVVVLVAAAFLVPKLLKAADPGCDYFKGTALGSYNQMIDDLNRRAPQSTLNADIQSAISQIGTAEGKASDKTVQTGLSNLRTQLGALRTDEADGSVPQNAVAALNDAAQAADNDCGTAF